MQFVTTIIFLLAFQPSFACSCIGEPSVKEQLKKSNYAFTGKVLSKKLINVEVISKPGMVIQKAEYIFQVYKSYKGKLVSDTLKIVTGIGKGDCGFLFMVGSEYVVYAVFKDRYYETGSNVQQYLYTNICTRTRLKNDSEIKNLERLRKGKKPPNN